MLPSHLNELIDERRGGLSRRVVGTSRAIAQPSPAVLAIAGKGHVAGLAADAVPGAEFGKGEDAELIVADEEETLGHGGRCTPWHGAPPGAREHASECQPCLRIDLSGMCPVRTNEQSRT